MFDIYLPGSLDDVLRFLSKEEALPIAGGTDLLPRLQSGKLEAKMLVDLSGLSELRYIREENGQVRIGALTTIAELYESPLLDGPLEIFKHVSRKFGGPQIRNMATVGGNLAASSSSEDLIPVFMALDARVVLSSVNGDRVVPIEKFILDKRKTARRANEIIKEVAFQRPPERAWTAFDKVGRRNILFIALVNMAVYLRMEDGKVADIRLALNRVKGKVPERAIKTESFLKGKELNDEVLDEAREVLTSELQLTSDFRASAEYRVKVEKAFLKRLLNYCRRRIEEGWP